MLIFCVWSSNLEFHRGTPRGLGTKRNKDLNAWGVPRFYGSVCVGLRDHSKQNGSRHQDKDSVKSKVDNSSGLSSQTTLGQFCEPFCRLWRSRKDWRLNKRTEWRVHSWATAWRGRFSEHLFPWSVCVCKRFCPDACISDRVLTLHKNGSCKITQWLFETFGQERSCVIEQEPFCGVRTHFYHDASLYDVFRDRRVVEFLFVTARSEQVRPNHMRTGCWDLCCQATTARHCGSRSGSRSRSTETPSSSRARRTFSRSSRKCCSCRWVSNQGHAHSPSLASASHMQLFLVSDFWAVHQRSIRAVEHWSGLHWRVRERSEHVDGQEWSANQVQGMGVSDEGEDVERLTRGRRQKIPVVIFIEWQQACLVVG